MKHSLLCALIPLILLSLSATPGGAAVFVRVADKVLAEQADLIAEVTVRSIDREAGDERPATDYLVDVERVIAGEALSTLSVRVGEGKLDENHEVRLFGAPRFEVGQRALLFLSDRGDGTWAVLHLLQGAFHLAEIDGREIAFRAFTGAREAKSDTIGARHPEKPRDLESFRQWIGDRLDGTVRPHDYFVELSEDQIGDQVSGDNQAHTEKFNLIRFSGTPARWREFEQNQAIFWRSHVDGQPGIADGGVSAIQAALQAWNNDANTNIDLRYAGTSTATAGADSRDSRNVVLFDDPNGDFDEPFSCTTGGTVASTFVVARTAQHTHDGQTFFELIEADVITNSNLECWLPVGVRAREIFAHEFGHSLGLSHSCGDDANGPCDTFIKDDALMRAQAHDDGRGANLRQDDRAGIAFVYGAATPAAPSNLTATAQGSSQIRLTWNDNSNNETQFEIQRRAGGGSFTTLANTGANSTVFNDSNVSSGTTYTYRVRARNSAGTSTFSNEASAAVMGEATPTNLTATATSESTVRLTWTDNSTAETGFEIEFTDGDVFTLLFTTTANSETATVAGFDSGTRYRFRVRAVGGTGASSYSNEAVATTDCVAGSEVMCLNQGRFVVEVDWRNFEDGVGPGSVVPFGSDDSGLLWFFEADNWEMLIKVLDGCGFNDHFWVFAAATTNVEYTLTVTDTLTSATAVYVNELGVSSPAITDIEAFATCDAGPMVTAPPVEKRTPPAPVHTRVIEGADKGGCVADETTLCLNGGRFQVEVDWRNFADETGVASVVPFGADDSGLLWFFEADNWEMLIKILDGCGFNDHFWVFSAATTNVEYTLRVTDTETGVTKEYVNPLGTAAAANTDTLAFPTCP